MTPLTAGAVIRIPAGAGTAIAPSFVGLSIEYDELAAFEQLPGFANFVSLLRVGGEPLLLRVGGESANVSYWHDRAAPAQAYKLTSQWLRDLGALTRVASLQVMLDLDTSARNPGMAARFAAAAIRDLPKGSVEALEIGNEPDLVHLGGVLAGVVSPAEAGGLRNYGVRSYLNQFRAYQAALGAAAIAVPLAGPATATPELRYVEPLLTAERSNLGVVTVHRYPFASCAAPSSPLYPTVAGYLRPGTQEGLAASVAPIVRSASGYGLPVRLSEFGLAVCGGLPGVTNSFATALWAPNTLFDLARVGVSGVNFHMRPMWSNSALAPQMTPAAPAQPLFYGMVLFAQTLGRNAHLLALASDHDHGLNVWAVRVAGGYHVLLDNESAVPRADRLSFPRQVTEGRLEYLTAPSPFATSTVELAGRSLDANGRWHGQEQAPPADCTASICQVQVPAYSAVLVKVHAPRA